MDGELIVVLIKFHSYSLVYKLRVKLMGEELNFMLKNFILTLSFYKFPGV